MKELNDDLLDEGLQAVMGKERCQNPEDWQKDIKKRKAERKASVDTAVDATWVPVKEGTSMDKVRDCAKWAMLFASVSGLLFYWQQAGLLDSSAAVPSLIFCALGAGLTIGWHAR
jgi:hypothetical protein